MSDRLIATEQSQDLVTQAILSEGNEVPGDILINQIQIFKEVNRIPWARMVILDGEVSTENFEISSSDYFVPGKEIEIQVGYHNDLKTVFKGIVVKQGIKVRSNGQSVLVVDCQDMAVKMTIGRKSKFFYDMKDSDVMEELIDPYGIEKNVTATETTHVQMVQYDATDWDFMMTRAEANNLLCFINDGEIDIKKADYTSDPAVELTFGANIIEYDGELDSRTQIEDIKASLIAERVAAKERFFQAKYSKPILLAITIAAFNQLSGINAILYYAPRVFSMAGFAEDSAFLSSAVIGFVMLVFTLIAMVIIDHFGRKKLMLYGSIGYIVSLGAIAVTFFSNGREFTEAGSTVVLISLIVFIAAHGFGQGAVIWVFISEIFPNKVRARGQALGSFTHWFMAALISWTFPVFAEISGGFIFTFYAFCMVLQLLWVLFKMPETKGITLEELQEKLHL